MILVRRSSDHKLRLTHGPCDNDANSVDSLIPGLSDSRSDSEFRISTAPATAIVIGCVSGTSSSETSGLWFLPAG